MYEKPTLIPVGKAEDVVLGIVNSGIDLDGLYMLPDLEFADDLNTIDAQ